MLRVLTTLTNLYADRVHGAPPWRAPTSHRYSAPKRELESSLQVCSAFQNQQCVLRCTRFTEKLLRSGASSCGGRGSVHPSERRLLPFNPFRPSLLGVATEAGMFFHGEIVSMMILRPAKALSTSRCTRSVSAFRNSCRALSSEVSPSSSLIELDVRRATEDLILSARCSALVLSLIHI